jgi:CRISPR-associated protein Csb2
MSALVLFVRLHDGRYHGRGDWPPSPARLFQALVAGAGLGGQLGNSQKEALEWLESRKPPTIGAPLGWQPRRGVLLYMPNNDSDSIGGDPARMGRIRSATKTFRPFFFDDNIPLVYAWSLDVAKEDAVLAREICTLAEGLYQLGRGIDMAWAWGEILSDSEVEETFAHYPGRILRPSVGESRIALYAPCPGSLESVRLRYRAFGERFRYVKEGRAVKVTFRKPPRARFQLVSYESPPSRQLYELRDPTTDTVFAPWPLTRVSSLVIQLRDGAVARLQRRMPAHKVDIDRVLIGRRPDGTNDCPPEDRVRIIPLPSIGHVHADREIRRVLIEVPATCPLKAADVQWAFSGLDIVDAQTGEIEAVLTRADDEGFLRHYGVGGEARYHIWRTVTPIALPEGAARRRIGPTSKREAAHTGIARYAEQVRAAHALNQALRHAGVAARIDAVRLQREPFEGRGARAETFAVGTRFGKGRLWHVEVAFTAPMSGPLLIGDGRFLGLGLMAPTPAATDGQQLPLQAARIEAQNSEEIAWTSDDRMTDDQ